MGFATFLLKNSCCCQENFFLALLLARYYFYIYLVQAKEFRWWLRYQQMSNQAAETNMDKGNTGIDKNGVTVDLHASNGLLNNKPSITVPERISSGFGSMHRSIPIQSPYQRSPAMRRHFSSMKVRRKSQLKKTGNTQCTKDQIATCISFSFIVLLLGRITI